MNFLQFIQRGTLAFFTKGTALAIIAKDIHFVKKAGASRKRTSLELREINILLDSPGQVHFAESDLERPCWIGYHSNSRFTESDLDSVKSDLNPIPDSSQSDVNLTQDYSQYDLNLYISR